MGRFFYPLVFLIAFSAFVFGGSIEATFFQPVQKTFSIKNNQKAGQEGSQENEQRCEEREFWPRTNCDPVAYFTLWLAGFTGILAGFTIGLWFVTLGIFRDSKQSAERQQRAYVLVDGVILSKDPQDENRFGATIHAKNFGQTPARDVVEWAQIAIRELNSDDPFIKPNLPNPSKSVLPPSGNSLQIPTHPNVEEIIRALIASGRLAIFVFGETHYIDAFDKERHTKFRFMCTGQGYAMGLFRQCGEGNDWT